jgi:hypothetical protein
MKRFGTRAVGAIAAVLLATGVSAVPTADAAKQSATARVAQVTLKANVVRVDAGKPLVLTGKVRNRPTGTKVTLEKFRAGWGWSKERTLKVGKGGTVRYVDHPKQAGARKYRLVVPKAGARPRATSSAVPVTVWRWINLSDFDYSQRRATFQAQIDSFLDGVRYEDVILADPVVDSGYMAWSLRGQCSRVRASLAATDRGTLQFAHVRLSADGVVLAEGEVEDSSGRDIGVSADLLGKQSLRFEWEKHDSDAAAAMYQATVYCMF